MRVYLWIGKISWRFHKHTILQISLKIWAAGLRVIPKNGETKSFSNRANSQRNTNTHSLHKIWPVLESWFPTKTFSETKKVTKRGLNAGEFWNNHREKCLRVCRKINEENLIFRIQRQIALFIVFSDAITISDKDVSLYLCSNGKICRDRRSCKFFPGWS